MTVDEDAMTAHELIALRRQQLADAEAVYVDRLRFADDARVRLSAAEAELGDARRRLGAIRRTFTIMTSVFAFGDAPIDRKPA